jgi:hypothetical protein
MLAMQLRACNMPVEMGTDADAPRVYLNCRRGTSRVSIALDLHYIDGIPVAVIAWANRNGNRVPAEYAKLDPTLLRPTFATGGYRYDGEIVEAP